MTEPRVPRQRDAGEHGAPGSPGTACRPACVVTEVLRCSAAAEAVCSASTRAAADRPGD